jgi:aryl-alcohol dehydrogenase-like predicted oxidoreductase
VNLPTSTFGTAGPPITRLGLGGEGILRTFGREREARDVIDAALSGGITYCESARAYAGSEMYYGKALGSRREASFLPTKAHGRTRAGALAMLEASLRALGTEHIDLWQVHDVREAAELSEMEADDGVYAACLEARARGLVRFVGVTGHHDPTVLREALERFAFDSVLLPVNPAEGSLPDAFERTVIPAARARGMAVIGMKVLARGLLADAGLGIAECIAYGLSADVDTIVVGCDDVGQVRENVAAASEFRALSPAARRALEQFVAPRAERLAYYRGPAPAGSSSRA